MRRRTFDSFLLLAGGVRCLPVSLARELKEQKMERNEPLIEENTVTEMVNHPAFSGFGAHLVPRLQDITSSVRLRNVGRLMPWHGFVQPPVVLDALNRMIKDSNEGKQVFYSFYPDEARKQLTGLFFFRGKPGAPFALICPGGGFAYVGALHEGFPLAQVLSREGFNAFVLQYRTGGERIACEDMAAAISWIFAHASNLEVSTENYSVWGGSAGARMAANLGSYGAEAFGGKKIPRPAAVIMAYTGHRRYTEQDPPTFVAVSEDDPIADWNVMKQRAQALSRLGIPTEFHLYHHAGHGFGTGVGSDAEGWMDAAVKFWERNMPHKSGHS